VLDGGSDPPWEGAVLGKWAPIVNYRDTAVTCVRMHPHAVWIVSQNGPRNHELHGVQIPHEKGQFWRKGSPIVKYRDFLP